MKSRTCSPVLQTSIGDFPLLLMTFLTNDGNGYDRCWSSPYPENGRKHTDCNPFRSKASFARYSPVSLAQPYVRSGFPMTSEDKSIRSSLRRRWFCLVWYWIGYAAEETRRTTLFWLVLTAQLNII